MNRRVELQAFGQPVVIADRSMPKLPADGVIVKITHAGICHTDVHLQDGYFDLGEGEVMSVDTPDYPLPMIMGHEIGGEVYKIGPKVDTKKYDFRVGDRVLVYPWNGCPPDCALCNAGHNLDCPKVLPFSNGLGIDGGFQQYLAVPKMENLLRAHPSLPMDVGALIPCSGITTYSAITRVLPTIEKFISAVGKADLFIVGAGGLGLWGIQIAKAIMPKGTRIICAECSETKFPAARDAGADVTLLWDPKGNPKENAARARALIPDGAQAGADFVGSEGTTNALFRSMANGATMATVGLFGGSLHAPTPVLALNKIGVSGVLVGTYTAMQNVMKLVVEGKVKGPPITMVGFEDVQDVLDGLRKGTRRGRSVIKIPH